MMDRKVCWSFILNETHTDIVITLIPYQEIFSVQGRMIIYQVAVMIDQIRIIVPNNHEKERKMFEKLFPESEFTGCSLTF